MSEREGEIRVSKWAVGLLVTVGIVLATQTITAIIVVTKMDAKLGYQGETLKAHGDWIQTGTQLRYTSADAAADKQMMLKIIDGLNQRIEQTDQRMKRLEDMHISNGKDGNGKS